jgi:hypothetical protein
MMTIRAGYRALIASNWTALKSIWANNAMLQISLASHWPAIDGDNSGCTNRSGAKARRAISAFRQLMVFMHTWIAAVIFFINE